MFTGNDVFYSIVGFAIFIITASILTGYLGSYATNKKDFQIVEGFEANENNLDTVNENISEGVTNLEDNLRVDKYKADYKKMSSLTKDYFDGLKIAILMGMKDIDPKKDKPESIQKKCSAIAVQLSEMHKAIETIEKIDM